jgi:hypothetical protein
VDTPNEHLVDVGNYVRPGEFEPGSRPSAPPAPLQATVVADPAVFDAMFPDVPGTSCRALLPIVLITVVWC